MINTQAQIRKLIDNTLTDTQLKNLYYDSFPDVYADFEGKSRSDRIRDLTEHVFRYGGVNVLLKEIKEKNPYGYNQFINPFKEFQLYELDLIPSIRDCLKKINRRRGLIPMSFSCSNQDFIMSFCQGLKKELSKETEVYLDDPPRTVTHYNKIRMIAQEIGEQSENLTVNNIGIFPVNIDECKRPEAVTNFLNKIQKSFEDRPNFCSIIIMFKKDTFSYPSNVICNNPEVQHYDLCTWINILMNKDNGKWKDAGQTWQNMAIKTLSLEKNEALDMHLLYQHLAYARNCLTVNSLIEPNVFLERVKNHLNLLIEEEE
jgi:hypothetical protein